MRRVLDSGLQIIKSAQAFVYTEKTSKTARFKAFRVAAAEGKTVSEYIREIIYAFLEEHS